MAAECALAAALFVFALLVRWPYLQQFPNFADEINEARFATGIAVGETFPLTAEDTYIGSLHVSILAAGPLIVMMRERCWRFLDLYPDLLSYFAVYRYAPGQVAGCVGPTGPQPGD